MIPVTTELFVQTVNGQKYVVCRKFRLIERLADSFGWIRPKNSPFFNFLTDRTYSYPDAWIVNQAPENLYHVPVNELQTKGFCIEHNNKHYIMPLGNFDHD